MATINELKWATLTATVNEMKSPNRFLQRIMFPGEGVTLPTEDIEIGRLTKGREIAPFVRKNGEGIMVTGHTEGFETVTAPNIRIKRPFTPSELLYGRRPGTVIFSPGAGMQMNAIRQHIARDMQVMADYITNAEEWLASMALLGVITYELADHDVFSIDFQRAAGNTITLTGNDTWDTAVGSSTASPLADIHGVKRILQDHGVQPTDCILGTEAADALLMMIEAGYIKMLGLEGLNVNAGEATFVSQFNEDGVIYLGKLGGVRFWEYGRTATHPDGSTTVNMVRPKFAEFISRSASSQRVMYYGAIPDMKLFSGRLFQTKRFSKSWEEEDPSARMVLTHTRPMPVLRRPDTTVSMQVVA
jgi:hypothetical protein